MLAWVPTELVLHRSCVKSRQCTRSDDQYTLLVSPIVMDEHEERVCVRFHLNAKGAS